MNVATSSVYYLELVTSDVEGTCRMYSDVFDYSFGDPVPELGLARVASLPNGSWCGIRMPLSPEERPIMKAYYRVADLDVAVREVAGLGARILLESMLLEGWGKIAIFEMGGIQQGLWQVDIPSKE